MSWRLEGEDIEAARRQYRESEGKSSSSGPPRRFMPVRFRDIGLTAERPYLVKGLLPREGLVVVWGPPKCGKSFWTFDVVLHVALGWEYRDRRVQSGTCVYVACEGERGLGARTEAFRIQKLGDRDADPPFYMLTTRLDLVADVDQLIADVRAAIDADCCSAIVIDTLNRSIAGSESRDEDMGNFVRAADKLREAFKAAVIIIHHCGLNGERPRGHTSLTGACDAQIAVRRDPAGRIVATVEHMKDGAEGDTINSQLVVVEVGTDEDGQAITSCVVEAAEGHGEAPAKQPKLTGAAAVGMEQLRNCLAAAAIDLPTSEHIPRGAKGVTLGQWRDYLLKAGVVNADGNPREQFRRIRVTLQDRGFIGVWDDFVWSSHSVTSASR